jgi:thioesterase domain-containing protein
MNTDYVQLNPGDVIAQVSNASFDAITFEVWGALLNGARVVVIPTEVVLSPKAFAADIQRYGITTLFLTTALFNQFSRELPSAFHSVHHLLFGGESSDRECVQQILRNSPPRRLLHVYGPTETTTFASWYLVERLPENTATVPIGGPIRNCRLYILDAQRQPVPIGVTGELYIGGDGLARGYLNRPELTAERFVADPFTADASSRLYKSGDLARFRADGSIELLGRLDQQVKLRGFRIEPGEIEETLRRHTTVRQAVVLPRESSPGNKILAAYVVLHEEQVPAPDDLRRWVAARLPSYMVPASFVFLERLPLTANGKVDHETLKRMDIGRPMTGDQTAPRDELETRLAKLWVRCLNLESVSIRDDFFELGGHSLLAVQLLADIERHTGKSLSLAAFFQAPTIEESARLLRQETDRKPATRSRLVPLQPEGSALPLFLLQGTMEIARKMDPDQPFYTCLPHGEDGMPVPPTVSEIAADYIREIRVMQPRGPYLIGGFSFSGLVAFEMAQQLRAQGEELGLLVMIDPTTAWPRSRENVKQPPRLPPESTLSFVKRHLRQLELRPAFIIWYVWRGVWRRVRGKIRFVTTPLKWSACQALLPVWTRLPIKPYALRKFYFLQASMRVARTYAPVPYGGDAVLFMSEASGPTESAWRRLITGKVHLYGLPGDHEEMVREPNSSALAEALNVHLRGVRGKARNPNVLPVTHP